MSITTYANRSGQPRRSGERHSSWAEAAPVGTTALRVPLTIKLLGANVLALAILPGY